MTQPPPLPHRPRLAEHATLRRHLVDGEERIAIHDPTRSEMIEIDALQLTQVMACDGTREIGGVVLACVRKGAFQRLSSLLSLLTTLHERGLLSDGIPVDGVPLATHPERPLALLPNYSLHCDQNGTCCTTYSSVPFVPGDAQRAIAEVPEVLDGADRDKVFLPLHAAGVSRIEGVTMVNGRCAFLGDDNGCRIHQTAGADAKPRGCRIFPASFVDDGEQVRVSVAVECACVLASVGRAGGASLVPEGATREQDLLTGVGVVRLAEEIAVSHERTQPRAALREWSTAVLNALPDDVDPLAGLWTLASAVSEHGLDVEASVAAVVAPQSPAAGAMAVRLMALSSEATSVRESLAKWRSEADRSRRISRWIDDAAQALMDQQQVKRLLEGPQAQQHEQFYLRSVLFGHLLVSPPLNLAQSLRDRATRLLLARKAAECIPADCQDDPSAAYPITAVESLMRGQGMASYAAGLP